MATTEKTPPLGNDGAEVLESIHPHDSNPRPTARYVELFLIRSLLSTRCGDVGTLCAGHDIRALCSEARRLVLSELQTHAAEQVRVGHPKQLVDTAEVMARVHDAGDGTEAMQKLLDAFSVLVDGRQAGTADVSAIPLLWHAVELECLWREMGPLADALREAAARRDAVAVLRLMDLYAPQLRNLGEAVGLVLDPSDTTRRENR
ncbi:hypothetical protein [Corynebacterium bovis]|uniref:hypothetical protein n=2 Tax=Corynebacterium bovis TaxID=36808 RepID=UPI000F63F564|nr:hypothetical protein [Corynebacterium bovis]